MTGGERVERVGLIGDVHTERDRLALALRFLSTQNVDRLLCTGDLADGPGDGADVDECVALLESHDVLTVSGNHDRWIRDHEMRDLSDATEPDEIEPETGDYLDRLPQTIELSTPAGPALLCHGLGNDDMALVQPHDHGHALNDNARLQELLREGRYRYVLNGHSHRPMVRTIDGLTIVNAGTLYTGQRPCVLVVDFGEKRVTFFDMESPEPIESRTEPL
ncbi:MAG: metallophosphoesterase family protein [Myxococcales bacterium]|jgi:predicted phosphodiesterase